MELKEGPYIVIVAEGSKRVLINTGSLLGVADEPGTSRWADVPLVLGATSRGRGEGGSSLLLSHSWWTD